MSRPKAKATTMVDTKLRKANEKIVKLEEQIRAAQFQVLNIRQMYEGMVGEKQAALGQLQRVNQMLMGALVQARGQTITLKESTLKRLSDFAGLDTKESDGNLIIRAVSMKAYKAMQEEVDSA